MKRIAIFCGILLMSYHVFSQFSSPQERRKSPQELEQAAARYAVEFSTRKAEALQMANQKGWTVRKEFPDGRVIEIMEIGPNGMPEYNTTDNLNAARTTGTNQLWTGGSTGLNLDGAGFTIGEWDGGGVRATHQEFRVDAGPSRVTQKDSPGSTSYHSTHVAGTLIAEGQVAAAHGMAPAASLHAYDWNNDISEMLNANLVDNIILSNHSYGRTRGWTWDGVWYWFGDTTISRSEDYQFGFYGQLTKTWDSLAYAMQDFLFVKSAGNDRGDSHSGLHYVWAESLGSWVQSSWPRDDDGGSNGYDCIGNRGTAKNLLTVGAVNDIPGGYTAPGDVVMTVFSGWGPTDDGRIKPDIVANGMDLYSCDDDADNDYTTLPGTSMAAPNVCGTLALLQDYHHDLTGSYMYADELKALVINTAHEAGTSAGPDYRFGWGLLNAVGAAALITLDAAEGGHIGFASLNNGEVDEYMYYSDGSEPINVTMVWIDPPHSALAPALNPTTLHLVKDLDIRVVRMSTGGINYPWRLNPTSPGNAATKNDNFRDNVEKVTITSPVAGHYKIIVSHKGALASAQWYALAVSGMHKGVPGRWIGKTSTNWSTLSNWDNYEVPTASVNVTIPAGCVYYPVLTGGSLGVSHTTGATYQCDNLYINSGGMLTITGNDLYCAGNIDLDGTLYVGNDAVLNDGAMMDLSGSFYTGYTEGWHGALTVNSGATINQTGGDLYTESVKLFAGSQYNGTSGYFYLYKQGFANATQYAEIDDPDSFFRYFYVEDGVNAMLYDCSYDLNAYSFRVYGAFSLNGFQVTANYSDIYGSLTIGSGMFDISVNGPYFHTGSALTMSGGNINGNSSIRFLSGSSENISGGTITLLGDFYNQYGVFTPAGGQFRFEGANASNIIGSTQFYDLLVNKTYSGFDAVENGTGDGSGVDIAVLGNLIIMDGSLELNSPCTLSVAGNIQIYADAALNANDAPDVYIQAGASWANNNLSGGFLSGTSSIVEFNAPVQPGVQIVRENNLFNKIIINSGAPYVRPGVDAGYGLIHCRNMDILDGSLSLSGKKVMVDQNLNNYDNLIMNNAADSLVVTNIAWKSGSTYNINNGRIIVNGSWTWENGTNAYISAGNIVEFKGSATGFIYSFDPNTAFYNLDINKGSGAVWIHSTSTQPVYVLHDMNVMANSLFHVQTGGLDVSGILDVRNGATMRLYSGGSVDLADDFTLNGYVHLSGGGDFQVHGSFSQSSTGDLNIGNGLFIVDIPYYSARAIMSMNGTLTMAGGALEITHNHLQFGASFVSSVSGGTIRVGGSFMASDNVFQPGGGTLELISYSGGGSPYIDLHNGNWLQNLVMNGNVNWLIGGAGPSQLTISQDMTINSGGLNGSDDQIYIGDDWTNNVGNAGFISGTGHVYFTGTNPTPDRQMITGTNTFYNLTHLNTNSVVEFAGPVTVTNNYNAGSGGASCETFITGTPVNIQGQLILNQGYFALSTSAPVVTAASLAQGGTIQLTDGTFTASDLAEPYIGGTYILYDGQINLYQDGSQYPDLNASLTIHGGEFNIYGGSTDSYWPYGGVASITMDGGILDFKDRGIMLYNNSFTENITGGIIRTTASFGSNSGVTTFTPQGGVVEVYGSNNSIISLAPGCYFHNLWSSKINPAFAHAMSDLTIKEELKVNTGIFSNNNYSVTVGE